MEVLAYVFCGIVCGVVASFEGGLEREDDDYVMTGHIDAYRFAIGFAVGFALLPIAGMYWQ